MDIKIDTKKTTVPDQQACTEKCHCKCGWLSISKFKKSKVKFNKNVQKCASVTNKNWEFSKQTKLQSL